METEPVLEVRHLNSYYSVGRSIFGRKTARKQVLHDVSFHIDHGEILGLVGESGCGKTTLSRTILGMLGDYGGGYDGEIVHRSKRPQMVFQDPFSSLNPAHTVGWILEEPLRAAGGMTAGQRRAAVAELLEEPLRTHYTLSQKELDEQVLWISGAVGLSPEQLERYPHQFSGGQRQRISIARALITKPRFVVADEPVSALDVSIQAQILNLLMELQQELKLSYLFISHDLNVVRHISNRVGIMYLGRMVEQGETEEVYRNPTHPYTQALLSAIPKRDPSEHKQRIHLDGDVPNPADPPKGCPFHDRCPRCMEVCKSELPVTREVSPGHFVSCHLLDK